MFEVEDESDKTIYNVYSVICEKGNIKFLIYDDCYNQWKLVNADCYKPVE